MKRPKPIQWNKDEILAYLGLVSSFIAYLNVDRREIAQRALIEARNLIERQSDLIRSLEAHIEMIETQKMGAKDEAPSSLSGEAALGESEARHSV